MSNAIIKSMNIKLCRQAFILANARPSVLRPPDLVLVSVRGVQNNLFQKVKKRTLEARTKLQANKFPHNQPCTVEMSPPQSTYRSNPATTAQVKGQTYSSKPAHDTTKKVETTRAAKTSQNIEVLSTKDCLVTNRRDAARSSSSDCDPEPECKPIPKCSELKGMGGGGPKRGGGDECPPPPKQYNMPLIIAGALGAGGLLLWLLLRRRKNKKAKDCEPVPEAVCPPKVQLKSSDLPCHVPYLLVGGGTAAFSAFRAIKSNDPKAKVLMITNEQRKPYMRPPLSKELWYSAHKGEVSKDYRFKQWTGAERSLFFEPEEFFVDPTKLMNMGNGGIAVAEGFTVRKVDPSKRIVTLMDGYEIGYDECLIATGCKPKNLEVFANASTSVKEKVMMYRTPDDFERLKRYADEKKSITIIGNGFIGSELACSLASYSKGKDNHIYQIFQESGNMSKVLPEYLSRWTTKKVEALGVCVLPNASIKEAQRDENKLKLMLSNGTTILTDVAVVCVGCDPNTSIAIPSGLEVDRSMGGFVVNAELEARRNLYVAGDASCFYDPLLGRRRVEHHDHSVVSGRLAGENMAGKKKAYTHQSMFWSDLGPEIGYEAIGLVDAALPTVGVFALPSKPERTGDNLNESECRGKEQVKTLQRNPEAPDIKCNPADNESYGKGVIFYLKDDKIVGILLWNLFNRIGLARTVINQNKKFDDLNEVAKLFEIHA